MPASDTASEGNNRSNSDQVAVATNVTQRAQRRSLGWITRVSPDRLADHEFLESFLAAVMTRRMAKSVARRMLDEFGTFASIIAALPTELASVEGLGEAGAHAIAMVRESSLRVTRSAAFGRRKLTSIDDVTAYLQTLLGHRSNEAIHVLFLNSINALLAEETIGTGSVNHCNFSIRSLIARAYEVKATALIIAHNHPGGDPSPSVDDIDMTRDLATAASYMQLVLHDHIIVANGASFSFRREGLLKNILHRLPRE